MDRGSTQWRWEGVKVSHRVAAEKAFAVKQLGGRLSFSGATLLCVVAYCLFAVPASEIRAGRDFQDNASSATNASPGHPKAHDRSTPRHMPSLHPRRFRGGKTEGRWHQDFQKAGLETTAV